MLDEAGRFGFSAELLDLVEPLWQCYQELHGRPESRLERLAGLAYIVAVLRQDVEGIWSQLVAAPELEGADLARLAADALGSPSDGEVTALRVELERRGWLR